VAVSEKVTFDLALQYYTLQWFIHVWVLGLEKDEHPAYTSVWIVSFLPFFTLTFECKNILCYAFTFAFTRASFVDMLCNRLLLAFVFICHCSGDYLSDRTVSCFSSSHTHTHTHPYNCPLSRTTWVSRYQKSKTSLYFSEARYNERQWHQLGHIQVCTSLQTDNHTSTPPLSFYRPDALPVAQPTALKH